VQGKSLPIAGANNGWGGKNNRLICHIKKKREKKKRIKGEFKCR